MPGDGHTDSWWLMDSSLPDLNWARLRVHADGRAEVFDCDGVTHRFPTEQAARLWLSEDEFVDFAALDGADAAALGVDPTAIAPPDGHDDATLRARMYVKAPDRT